MSDDKNSFEFKFDNTLNFLDMSYLKSALKNYSKDGMPDSWQTVVCGRIYRLVKKLNDVEKKKLGIAYSIADPKFNETDLELIGPEFAEVEDSE